ncbi:MAG: DUF4062 domain-containing protein [Eubacterium sp.]|nr:DUF4062 domain-containing protein [Eubacterium sp.]
MENYTKELGKKTFRIFISSTFADMHAERDYLREHAFRRISAEMMKEGYGFMPVDLRGSVEETYADSERNVFHMCLRRVDDCRPRFLGLVGERYGWICYDDKVERGMDAESVRLRRIIEDICGETGLAKEEIKDKSMTQIEMLYGLKNVKKDQCFFYFREKLPAERLNGDRSLYIENPAKQDALKDWIQSEMADFPDNCHTYHPLWKGEGIPLAGLEELDRMVYEDLHESLMAEIAALEKTEEDPQEAYVAVRLAGSLERKRQLDRLENAALNFTANPYILVSDKDGSGKSTLMAQLYMRLKRREGLLVLPYFAGVGDEFAEMNNLYSRFVRTLIAEGSDKLPKMTVTDDESDWREFFRSRLAQAAQKKKVILLVDAVDELDTNLANPMLLAGSMPDNVMLIASAGEGFAPPAALDTLTASLDNGELTDEDFNGMIAAFAESYGKTLDSGIRRELIGKVRKAGSSPLYARLLVDYIMKMTGADYRQYAGSDAHRVWMSKAIEEIPPSVSGAFFKVLERAREAYGGGQVMCLVSLLGCVKGGIRTAQLKTAMEEMGVEITDIELFEIRDALSAYLRQDTDMDWWKLEYPVLGKLIIEDYDKEQMQALHSVLVTASDDLDVRDIFKAREYLYHCFMANNVRDAELYLTDMKFSFPAACAKEIRQLKEILNMEDGIRWERQLVSNFRTPSYPGFFLEMMMNALRKVNAELTFEQRLQIMEMIKEACWTRGHLRNAPVAGKRYCQEQTRYCTALIFTGDLYRGERKKDEAEKLYRQAERELEKLEEDFPGTPQVREAMMVVKSSLGDTQYAKDIAEKRLQEDADNPFSFHDAGVACMENSLKMAKTDRSGAIRECSRGIELLEKAVERTKTMVFTGDNRWIKDLAAAYAARGRIYGPASKKEALADLEKAAGLMREDLKAHPEDAERVQIFLLCILEIKALADNPFDMLPLYEEGAAAFSGLDVRAGRNKELYNPFSMICGEAASLCAKMRNPNGMIVWLTRNEDVLVRNFDERVKTPGISQAYFNIFRSLESAYRYLKNTAKADEYQRRAAAVAKLLQS